MDLRSFVSKEDFIPQFPRYIQFFYIYMRLDDTEMIVPLPWNFFPWRGRRRRRKRIPVPAYHEASDNAAAAAGGVVLHWYAKISEARGGRKGGRVHNLAIDGLIGPGGRCTKAHVYTSYPSFHEESQYLPGTRPLMKSIDLLQISAYRSKPVSAERNDHERDRGGRGGKGGTLPRARPGARRTFTRH